MASAKIIVKESTIRKKINELKDAAKDAVKTYQNEITQEYIYSIRTFYNDYNPNYYYRHWDGKNSDQSILASGLGHTFQSYYHDNGKKVYGGIKVSPEYMFNDYADKIYAFTSFLGSDPFGDNLKENSDGTKERRASSYLNSWHGNPNLGIVSGIHVYRYMQEADEKIYSKVYDKFQKDIEKILGGN